MPAAQIQEKIKPVAAPVPEKETESESAGMEGELNWQTGKQPENPDHQLRGTDQHVTGKDHVVQTGLQRSTLTAAVFGNIPLYVQPKLTINNPGDAYEQEADTVADQVMSMPDNSTMGFSTIQPASSNQSPATPVSVTDTGTTEEEDQQQEEIAEENSTQGVVVQKVFSTGDDDNTIRRKESGTGTAVNANAVQQLINGGGQPLDKHLREKMERRFGFDFGKVRIHNNTAAHQSAKEINARAYTWRNNIVFGKDNFQPGTREGQRLLAHELTHVIQQNGGHTSAVGRKQASTVFVRKPVNGDMIQRDEEMTDADREVLNSPIKGKVTASIFDGLEFTPDNAGQTFKEGAHLYIQGHSAVISALAGSQYTPELVTGYFEWIGGVSKLVHRGGGEKIAGANEKMKPFSTGGRLPALLISFFDNKNIPFPQDLRDIIVSYYDLDLLYDEIKGSAPNWFTRNLLGILVLSKKTWLTQFGSLKRKENRGEKIGTEVSSDYYEKLEEYVLSYTNILETVRLDKALVEEPAYAMLWGLPVNKPDAKIKISTGMAGGDYINPNNAKRFLQQCFTDIADAEKAILENETGHKARLKLLKDAMSLPMNGSKAKGNTTLSDRINRYNAPAFPSTLQSYPPLEPPLFELVSGTSPTFSMSVEWGDFYDALGFAFAGSYGFELIRVSDEVIQNLIKIKEGNITDDTYKKAGEEMEEVKKIGDDNSVRGETPTIGGVIGQKIERRLDYFAEDVETVFDGIGVKYGVGEGMGLISMDAVGNAFGAIGDVISSFWDEINADRWEKKIPIVKPGLYIIRATAFVRDIPENAEYVHAPSVAWMPVWARSAQDYSTKYLEQVIAGREGAESQLSELNKRLLSDQPLTDEERKKITDQRDTIDTLLHGTVEKQLELRKRKIEEALAADPDKDTREMLEKQKTEVEHLIKTQHQRALENTATDPALEAPFSFPVVFVADDGPTTKLYLELIEKPRGKNTFSYFVSDLTSSKMSSHAGSPAGTREDAIILAITEYLQQPERYGRGYCSVSIPPAKGTTGDTVKKTFRIKNDTDAIALSAVENITSALTVILIAAAPFTGGASLALLLPVGIVGAIPSGYRLYDRVKGDSFYLDWGTGMDIVNVLSSFAGLGGKAASSLKLVTVGKGFAIIGLGLDGLGFVVGGAKTLEDIDAISKRTDLSPGARRAKIISAVGGQLANVGLSVGTKMYETGKLMEKSAAEENAAGKKPPAQENSTNSKQTEITPANKETPLNGKDSTPPADKAPDAAPPADNTPANTGATPGEGEIKAPAKQTPANGDVPTPTENVPAKLSGPIDAETKPAKGQSVDDAPPVQDAPSTGEPSEPADTETKPAKGQSTDDIPPAQDTPAIGEQPVPAEPETKTPKGQATEDNPSSQDNTPADKTAKPTEAETKGPQGQTAEATPGTGDKAPAKKPAGTGGKKTGTGKKPSAAKKPKKTKGAAQQEPEPEVKPNEQVPADETVKPQEEPSPAPAEEKAPAEKENKPVADETENKKPADEEGKTNENDTPATGADETTQNSPLDQKIAAGEAKLNELKAKQAANAERMKVLRQQADELIEKRKGMIKRQMDAQTPEEGRAIGKEMEAAKRQQKEIADEYNELFEDSNTLSSEIADLEKSVKGLKDLKIGRVPNDINVDPVPPPANNGNGKIGTTPNQDTQLHADVLEAKKLGATDIRVNQEQVDASGKRVGTNRPDLQYTLNGQRYYIEYEHPNNPRGEGHTQRILANDQNGIVTVKLVPNTPGFTPGKGVVPLTKP